MCILILNKKLHIDYIDLVIDSFIDPFLSPPADDSRSSHSRSLLGRASKGQGQYKVAYDTLLNTNKVYQSILYLFHLHVLVPPSPTCGVSGLPQMLFALKKQDVVV